MNTLKQSNAIIFDDHSLFSESLSLVLEKFKIFNSIYTYKTEEEITQYFINRNIYDQSGTVIFIDYYLPQKNGLSLIKEIRRMDKKVKVVFLSSVSNPMVINEILQANPNAIVNKTEGIDELLEALKHIVKKQQYISHFIRDVLNNLVKIDNPLSSRETELLGFFSKGISTEEIAAKLYISPLTVVTHKRNMMKKTNSKTILELVAFARKNGLIAL